jgi:hypothetical protein
VSVVPAASTRAIVKAELPGAIALGGRHNLVLDWSPDDLTLRVTGLRQPRPAGGDAAADEHGGFILVGHLDAYRALPPVWAFEDPDTSEMGTMAAYPMPNGAPISSIFITSNGRPIVCAPFSRDAYGEHGGPHNDWGSASGWLEVGGGVVRATTIGEMLNQVVLHLSWTRGRMGPRARP